MQAENAAANQAPHHQALYVVDEKEEAQCQETEHDKKYVLTEYLQEMYRWCEDADHRDQQHQAQNHIPDCDACFHILTPVFDLLSPYTHRLTNAQEDWYSLTLPSTRHS